MIWCRVDDLSKDAVDDAAAVWPGVRDALMLIPLAGSLHRTTSYDLACATCRMEIFDDLVYACELCIDFVWGN